MARHENQRALTVNTQRVNLNPQAPAKRQPLFDDVDIEELGNTDMPTRLGASFHLLLTGQARAGHL